tara:strand:- start:142 stop:513 length:372 start_codon:yes stop_codon:yes gene_type:complete
MTKEYNEIYQVDNLKTKTREYKEDICIELQDIERTYIDEQSYTAVHYTAKGWWGSSNFRLRRDKQLSRYNDGAWEVSWSSGGFEATISLIERLETVQQIMEDMKHFLEYGEFLFQDETKAEEE